VFRLVAIVRSRAVIVGDCLPIQKGKITN